MLTKTVACPRCKNHIEVQGNPGDTVLLTCPKCENKGKVTFPATKSDIKSTDRPYSIEINTLTKKFKNFTAVDNVSFKVKKGEIYGFLGPNGAGKTTTIKAMLGLIHMNSGNIQINGFDIIKNSKDARKNIGYLPELVSFYENLTPVQTLNFFCEMKGQDKSIVKPLLKEVGLDDAIDKKVGNFSKGMRQLLGIAQTMVGSPNIYILDEPMAGLDARWVKIVRDKIKMLNEQGATIMFSSHILSEVQNLCSRVAIINKGKIIAEDTVPNLNKYLKIKPRLEIEIPGLKGKVPKKISDIKGIEKISAKEDILYITCDSSVRIKVINALEKAGMEVKDIKTFEPSLEDAFMKLLFEKEEDK
jgi:ABC-2 type transport system ATP-binding protein